jgi:hypothetical protein
VASSRLSGEIAMQLMRLAGSGWLVRVDSTSIDPVFHIVTVPSAVREAKYCESGEKATSAKLSEAALEISSDTF